MRSAMDAFLTARERSDARFGERMGGTLGPANDVSITHFRDDFRKQVASNVALFSQPAAKEKIAF